MTKKEEKKSEWKYRIIKATSFNWNIIYIPQKKEHIFFIPYWDWLVKDHYGAWFDCWFPTIEEAEKEIENDMCQWEYEVVKQY